ncbi:helitron helicase-like domain-containing protein [Artemisia annua]|uniref:Helitron helicase-like domain-containing protein n=1 Tax=Artemisia annua TaxID=35608 RepID=A0A2U1LW92_ARTAN|nr:helitron helicase-like domain-containing protein [Artemisia annua]
MSVCVKATCVAAFELVQNFTVHGTYIANYYWQLLNRYCSSVPLEHCLNNCSLANNPVMETVEARNTPDSLMPRRLLRNDFAPLTNTYMHSLTHNNGYEKKQLVENENDLHYNGTLITDSQVSTENDNFIHTMRHHVGPSNVNSSNLDLYGQQQNLSITDTQISAENDKFVDKMQHHVDPSNVNNTNLDLYGQPQNLSISWKNQPFYQQSMSTTNKQTSNQIHYLGESNATISDNLGTKKDATYIPDKRKRRIAAMFKDVAHHAKRCKGIQIRENSNAARECNSDATYNESSNNKGKTLTFEAISMHAQPVDPYETVMPENATDTIDQDMSPLYIDIGDCQYACQYCNAAFWYSERSKKSAECRNLKYTKCCAGGQVYLERELEPPIYLKQIFKDKHFLDNIRAYNQMFSMTSFGAQIDDTINDGRGSYVFKISGQIHHWIGTICPTNKDESKFMQIYMFDTDNEVAHRMEPFGGKDSSGLKPEIVQHLIQILDANNELVQVFRTARDRINEGNIGDFKIQLYNVVGNRRYDLPSSHTLGAIVFEPDGNSQTDYDIIIEYKDRQPQRINKLHSSYMSLQYPLIFVYGQPGFNTKMTLDGVNATTKRTKMSMNMFYKYQLHERMAESSVKNIHSTPGNKIVQVDTNIKDLRPKHRNRIIQAIVYRAWIARDPPDTTEKGCRAILLDKQGDAIQGNMDIRDKSFFTKVFIPGRAYRISNFACYPTDNWQQTLENPTSLSFTRFSNFDAISPEGFPAHYFNFVSYNHYIGCYISSGNAETIGNPNKDQMVNRKIEIQNLNRVSIELTLWDELAEKFEKNEIDKLERPVIIAISSCRVQRYYNRLQLSSTPASYYYINPRIPQLDEYRSQYKQLFNINPPLEIVRQPYEDIEKERIRNRFPLHTLLNQAPKTYEGVRFTCEGTISGINTSRDLYYTSCTKCSLKVSNDDGIFQCGVHGALANPSYRYNFKGYLTDGSATVMITFFTPKADDIVGVNCNSLVASLKDPNPKDIPEKIHSITGKNHIFQFQYNTSSKQTTQEEYTTNAIDIPQKQQLALAIQSTPPSTPPSNEMSTQINLTGEQPAEEMVPTESTPAVTPPPNEISAQMNPMEEQPAKELAPTAKAYTGMQTRSRTDAVQASNIQYSKTVEQTNIEPPEDTDMTHQNEPVNTPVQPEDYLTDAASKSSTSIANKPTSSKRALFQGKTADAKKNKKE